MIELAQANAYRIPLRDESVHCIVTSPPYFGLRRYSGQQEADWPGARMRRVLARQRVLKSRRCDAGSGMSRRLRHTFGIRCWY